MATTRKNCKECGTEFEAKVHHAMYCNALCANRYYRKQNKPPATILICTACGGEFEKKAHKHNTCAACKIKNSGKTGDKIEADFKQREYTNKEQDMIAAFLGEQV